MESYHKESTHKRKKTLAGCPKCWKRYVSCQICRGTCIFSLAFFNACQYNKKHRKTLESKYFAEEFNQLREFFKGDFECEKDEIYADDETCQNEYEILQAFHENSTRIPKSITKKHDTPYLVRKDGSNKFGVLMSQYSMKGRCSHHRKISDDHLDSNLDPWIPRIQRKQNIMKASRDFVMI